MTYQYRTLEEKLKKHANTSSVVGLKGPVGAGKTTLLVNLFPEHHYLNFEDSRTLLHYHQDPKRFLRQLSPKIIVDEIQHIPELIEQLVLQSTDDNSYILVASCLFRKIRGVNLECLKKIKMLTLLPYQLTEVPNQLREQSIYQGGFPALVANAYLNTTQSLTQYIQFNLLKQLPSIGMVSDQKEFQRLLHLLAANTAKPLNLSYYAKTLSVDVKTIKRWIELLAASFIVLLIPPYHDNFGKRHLKSPKLYFYDTGLVSYLTGIETMKQFEYGPLANAIYENYVVMEILKKTLYEETPAQFYYYATNHGVSVDLIIEQGQKRQMICIHFNETFRMSMVQPIETFKQEDDDGYLIYNGTDIPYHHNIQIHNVSTYLRSN